MAAIYRQGRGARKGCQRSLLSVEFVVSGVYRLSLTIVRDASRPDIDNARCGAIRNDKPGASSYACPMSLSPDELARYARHIVLRHVGGPGQQKLKNAHVLVIGAGGLGAPVLQYLAGAGVGRLTIVDDDTVSLSNLQRQVIHGTADIGRPKVESAAEAIARLNPHVAVETVQIRGDAANLARHIAAATVVADCTDNFAGRFAISDACFREKVPLITAAVNEFDASLTTLRPFETQADGTPNPTYRCLFPAPPPAEMIPACSEAGVLGALVGVAGSLQAMEVIREIVGFGEGLVGRLLLIDALTMRFETMEYAWDPANPLTGRAESQKIQG